MDQSERIGFSLFPMPPTPPANKPRARAVVSDPQRMVDDDSTVLGSKQTDSNLPQLRPAPLRLRKKKLVGANHPSTTASPRIGSNHVRTPSRSHRRPFSHVENVAVAPRPETSFTVPEYPPDNPVQGFATSTVPRIPCLEVQEPKPTESTANNIAHIKKPSYRASQWLDRNGQIDRKKLSVYLNRALDTSFDVVEDPLQSPLLLNHARWSTQKHSGSVETEPYRLSYMSDCVPVPEITCRCPPGAVICHCHSSQEFEDFRRRHAEHKPNPSISSTTCFLSVPRARFQSTLVNVQEVDTPSSPPDLMYDSEDSDEFDWSLPNSPTIDERQLRYQQTPTPLPREPNTGRPSIPSFSLPFSHGKQIRSRLQYDRDSGMSWGQQTSPSSTIPTLASISTISTFTFEFGGDDDVTEYDPFEQSCGYSEIRTWEPIQKAKPILVHCRGPSPQSIKYGQLAQHRTPGLGSPSSGNSCYTPISV